MEENYFLNNRQSQELLKIILNPYLRWQDDPTGLRIARHLLINPQNEHLREWFNKKLQKRVNQQLCFLNNPFYVNFPAPQSLPELGKGRIPLALLPTGEWLSIELKALCRNALCVGPSGGGKSNQLRGTIGAILNAGGTAIAFDRKGTFELVDCQVLLKSGLQIYPWKWSDLKIAPLQPIKGISRTYWANILVSVLSMHFGLIASSRLLLEAVHDFYRDNDFRWQRLIMVVEEYKPESFRSEQYKDTLLKNLKAITFAFGDVVNCLDSNMIEKMVQDKGSCHVISTDGLTDDCASLLASFFIMREFERRRLDESSRQEILVFVLDDSLSFVHKGRENIEGHPISPLSSWYFLTRSLGISFLLSFQNFNACSPIITNNSDTIVACGSYGDDAYALSKFMNLTPEQTSYLGIMRPGEVVVLARSEWQHAVLGYYPLIS